MSCRPRGPSDRPIGQLQQFYEQQQQQQQHQYDQDALEGGSLYHGNPPRLQGQGIGSKVLIGMLLMCCCGVIGMCGVFAMSIFVQLPPYTPSTTPMPPLEQQQQQQVQQLMPQQQQLMPQHSMHRHAQRSVLQRLAMLKRAPAPQKGVDLTGMGTIFPHWLNTDGELDSQTVLRDVLLALSYLAQEDETPER